MQYKILFIDDDSDDRTFFSDAIKKNYKNDEVSCITLDSGHALMSSLTSNIDVKPNIIFTDVNMPGMSGWEILSFIKNHDNYKDIPVGMLSTSTYPEEIAKAKTLDAISFLTKPSDFGDLQKALKNIIDHLRGRYY